MTQLRYRLALATFIPLMVVLALIGPHTPADAAGPAPTPTPICPPGDFFDPVMNLCRPLKRECPAGLIDVNGNGNDDGDCEPLDTVSAPASCWPDLAGPNLGAAGAVECALPWRVNGAALRLMNSAGCLDIRRSHYPRAIVGVPVEFRVRGILPTSQINGITFGQAGSYRVSTRLPWATEGLYLHERYGAATTDSAGRPAFNTRALLGNDPYPFPSRNNVRAHLEFRMLADDSEVRWLTERLPAPLRGGLQSPLQFIYPRSSFPLPEYGDLYSTDGPARSGANNLPALRLQVQTRWQLVLVSEWDNYTVNAAHEYIRGAHERLETPISQPYLSSRAWDSRQSAVGAEAAQCNAASGYIPVPVIEAQAVLQP
jgi:hypothetical protein